MESIIDLEPYLRVGVVPTKYGYLAAGANDHIVYSASTEYRENTHHIDFDLAAIMQFQHHFSGQAVQIVDLGAGDGNYTVSLISSSGIRVNSRYLAVDISLNLASHAAQSMNMAGISDAGTLKWDFETENTNSIERWRDGEDPILCLLLGNTLSNLESPISALQQVVTSIRKGDYLSISVRLWNDRADHHELLKPYESDELQAAVLSSFRSGGVDGDFSLHFELREREIIGRASLVALRGCPSNLARYLRIGTEYICFRSRRWLPNDFFDCLTQAGLSITWKALDQDFATALAEKLEEEPV